MKKLLITLIIISAFMVNVDSTSTNADSTADSMGATIDRSVWGYSKDSSYSTTWVKYWENGIGYLIGKGVFVSAVYQHQDSSDLALVQVQTRVQPEDATIERGLFDATYNSVVDDIRIKSDINSAYHQNNYGYYNSSAFDLGIASPMEEPVYYTGSLEVTIGLPPSVTLTSYFTTGQLLVDINHTIVSDQIYEVTYDYKKDGTLWDYSEAYTKQNGMYIVEGLDNYTGSIGSFVGEPRAKFTFMDRNWPYQSDVSSEVWSLLYY